MEIVEKSLEGWLEVQRVKAIRRGGAKKWLNPVGRAKWTYLNISLFLFLALPRQSSQQGWDACWSIN